MKNREAVEERARIWAVGDSKRAEKLIRKTQFSLSGKAWGTSLAESGEEMEADRIVKEMDRIARLKSERWRAELVDSVIEGIQSEPYDVALYLAMAEDLGDAKVAEEVKLKMGLLGLDIPKEMIEAGRSAYEKMAGKSYWEMPEEQLLWTFSICYYIWLENVGEMIELWDLAGQEGDKAYEEDGEEALILVGARSHLRELAGIILSRKLIKEGEAVDLGHHELSYQQLLEFLN